MPKLMFLPSGKIVDALPGQELMPLLAKLGLPVHNECGGKGTCGSCLITVVSGSLVGASSAFLPREVFEAGYRLACVSRVGEEDALISLESAMEAGPGGVMAEAESAQFAESLGPEERHEETLVLPGEMAPTPLVLRARLKVPPAQPLDGLSDWDRLTRALKTRDIDISTPCPLRALRKLAGVVRRADADAMVIHAPAPGGRRVVDIQNEENFDSPFGVAIDVGTTSVAVSLVDMARGSIVDTQSEYNGQMARGLDVISRINYARRDGGLNELRRLVQQTVNGLVRSLMQRSGLRQSELIAGVLAGNTVMTHLLLGLDPEHIRLEPYTPSIYAPGAYRAAELGLKLHHEAPVLIAPAVGSYVGGDITAGLLLSEMSEREELTLFIDVGTNGEVVVGNNEFMMGCACSAGPAFEGAGISCGMRASAGAVEKVRVDKKTGAPTLQVLGGGRPAGICGTGVIGLMAELVRTGWLDAAGKLKREPEVPHIISQERNAAYVLAPGDQSATGEAITLSERDVENAMRAKAAVYAGCDLLLAQAGLSFDDVERVVIAGGFGRFLDVEQAISIGLLPDLPRKRFSFVGNASRMGAAMALLSEEYRTRLDEIAQGMTYIDLSNDPGYMDHYMAAMFLPHTDAAKFPSVKGKN